MAFAVSIVFFVPVSLCTFTTPIHNKVMGGIGLIVWINSSVSSTARLISGSTSTCSAASSLATSGKAKCWLIFGFSTWDTSRALKR